MGTSLLQCSGRTKPQQVKPGHERDTFHHGKLGCPHSKQGREKLLLLRRIPSKRARAALRKHQRVGGSLGRDLLQHLAQEGRPEPPRDHKKSCKLLDCLCLQEKQQKQSRKSVERRCPLVTLTPVVFQHIQESWFEAVHVGWGRNS